MAYNSRRKVVTLEGIVQLRIAICQCHTLTCPQYHVRYHPEEEGRWALPHGEFGLDVIALIGAWRFQEHRSVPEMHQRLQARGLMISERAVTHLMHRYEELVTLRITDQEQIKTRLQKQGQVILALDGLQPDVGHEVLWVVRDCLSEEILLARPLLSSTQGDITAMAGSQAAFGASQGPNQGILRWRGNHSKRCGLYVSRCPISFSFITSKTRSSPFMKPIGTENRIEEARARVRPIERALEEHPTPENEAIRDYCLAARASLTDDGRSPLEASGLRLYSRIKQIAIRSSGAGKKRLPPAIKQLHQLLTKGLRANSGRRLSMRITSWIRQSDPGESPGDRPTGSRTLLAHLANADLTTLGPLGAFEHFCHITNNFAAGLFRCYECRSPSPTMIWSIVSASRASMNGALPVGEEPFPVWWFAARFA